MLCHDGFDAAELVNVALQPFCFFNLREVFAVDVLCKLCFLCLVFGHVFDARAQLRQTLHLGGTHPALAGDQDVRQSGTGCAVTQQDRLQLLLGQTPAEVGKRVVLVFKLCTVLQTDFDPVKVDQLIARTVSQGSVETACKNVAEACIRVCGGCRFGVSVLAHWLTLPRSVRM